MTATQTPPIDLARQLAAEVATRNAEAEQAYLGLIRSPDGVDAKRLLAAADKTGRTPQQVQSDLAAIGEVQKARANLPDMNGLLTTLNEAGAAIRQHDDESKEIELMRGRQRSSLDDTLRQARQRLNAAQEGRRRLARLEAGAWRLLGGPDPEEAQRAAEAAQSQAAQAQVERESAFIAKAQKVANLEQNIHALKVNPPAFMPGEEQREQLARLEAELETARAIPVQ